MSFSSSLRSFIPKFPTPICKTLTLKTPQNPFFNNHQFIKTIKIQSIPTKPFCPKSIPGSSPDPITHSQPISHLPQKLQEIIELFQSVKDPRAKYNQLLFYGSNLKPLDTQFQVDENKVKGCVSQVWVRAYFNNDSEKKVVFEADSDALLVKGLAALLVQGLSGCSVDEILQVEPDFVTLLDLQQSLSPSRNNGFLNMLQLMKKKALDLLIEPENGSVEFGKSAVEKVETGAKNETLVENESSVEDSSDLNNVGVLGSRGTRMLEILKRELKPVELELKDVSYQHAGHAGVKGSSDGETHFNLKVVSSEFEGKSSVKRHRFIYSLLADEMKSGLHALSIEAKTPAEIGR